MIHPKKNKSRLNSTQRELRHFNLLLDLAAVAQTHLAVRSPVLFHIVSYHPMNAKEERGKVSMSLLPQPGTEGALLL